VNGSSDFRLQPGRALRREEAQELSVVFACHHLVCALPARCIERLVLPEEVTVLAGHGVAGEGPWHPVLVGEHRYAGCNLGTQLGMPAVDAAWALLRRWHRGVELPIALQTGPCLLVQPLGPGVPLPDGIFRERPGVVAAAFPTALLRSRAGLIEVGLRLDPDRLWAEADLDGAAAVLGAENGGDA
jgi:hypothetical protein